MKQLRQQPEEGGRQGFEKKKKRGQHVILDAITICTTVPLRQV